MDTQEGAQIANNNTADDDDEFLAAIARQKRTKMWNFHK